MLYHDFIAYCSWFVESIDWVVKKNLYNVCFINTDFYIETAADFLEIIVLYFKFDWLNLFSMCMDLVVYDQPNWKFRFTIIYYLLSVTFNQRLHLLTQIGRPPRIKTISLIYKSANWVEREAWDMFGIVFSGHNDLRRILTDYGFKAFPLRKDFPLTGFYEVVYNHAEQMVVYIIVTLSQEFRKYYYENPWLGKKLINVEFLTPSFVEFLINEFWLE